MRGIEVNDFLFFCEKKSSDLWMGGIVSGGANTVLTLHCIGSVICLKFPSSNLLLHFKAGNRKFIVKASRLRFYLLNLR